MAHQATSIIHPSLVQAVLIAGAEREYTIMIGLVSVLLWIAGKSILAFVLAVLTWVIGMAIGRFAAKKDPQAMKIWLRHLRYHDAYQASERVRCTVRSIPSFNK